MLTPEAVMRLHMEHSAGHCCTTPRPDLTDVQSVAMEFFATSFLVMMVCACSDSRNSDKADSTPLKFACTILALSVAVVSTIQCRPRPRTSRGQTVTSLLI